MQQRIRRNKKCLAFAYFGILFLQRLISGSIRSLTASEKRLNKVRGWVYKWEREGEKEVARVRDA